MAHGALQAEDKIGAMLPHSRRGVVIGVFTRPRLRADISVERQKHWQKLDNSASMELCHGWQSLQELQAAQDRLVQTQKLASLGQLTAGANSADMAGLVIDGLADRSATS